MRIIKSLDFKHLSIVSEQLFSQAKVPRSIFIFLYPSFLLCLYGTVSVQNSEFHKMQIRMVI